MKWETWVKSARHAISLAGIILNDDELLRDYFTNGYSPEYAAMQFVTEMMKGKPKL